MKHLVSDIIQFGGALKSWRNQEYRIDVSFDMFCQKMIFALSLIEEFIEHLLFTSSWLDACCI